MALLLIALAAVAVLLVLVIKAELPAYVALLLVSMGTAIVTGIAIQDVVPVMIAGMGNVLGSVAIVVGLGSMIGRLIEVSGGADHLARTFTEKLGRKRVAAALTIAAFILGIPVFFDVGFIILAPIVFGFAKVAGINPLKLALPVGAILLTVHVTLPPTPAQWPPRRRSADVGLVTVGLFVISAIVGVIAFFVCKMFGADKIVLGASPASMPPSPPRHPISPRCRRGHRGCSDRLPDLPDHGGSTLLTILPEDSTIRPFASFVGAPTTALLLGLLVAYLVIGGKARWNKTRRSKVAESALPIVAIIIFVTACRRRLRQRKRSSLAHWHGVVGFADLPSACRPSWRPS
ncbi:MAG: SLC13 family permease [Tessaracoccus sp.]